MLTDDLGSVRSAISNTAGSATVVGYMGYGPFGFLHYHAGQTGTNKGYTGQYNDPLSGLDYYNARYYDPAVGLFLSADTVQSNLLGFDPYAYVSDNPETMTDPTGHDIFSGVFSGLDQAIDDIYTTAEEAWNNWVPEPEAEVAASITTAAIIDLIAPIVIPVVLVAVVLSIPSDSPLPSASSQNQRPPKPTPSKPTSSKHPSPTPSTDASGVGARCMNSRCHDLNYSEKHLGHTLAQHVNVTPTQVSERAQKSRWYASMFTDPATAQWAVDQVLNSGVLPAKNEKGYWEFTNINVHRQIRLIWRPNGTLWGPTSYVTVSVSPLTWSIETAFPSNPKIPIK